MSKKVIVIGGGVAGMSAAQELSERGFQVEVYERQIKYVGGKARSVEVPDSAKLGKKPLPGEHGFRFFPAFYKHLINTMSRIPVKDPKNPSKKKYAVDNLVKAEKEILARENHNPLVLLSHLPRSLRQLRQLLRSVHMADLGFTRSDEEQMAMTLWQILTSSLDRRQNEYERVSWWRFSKAELQSSSYQVYFADGLTRTLVAAKSKQISAKTGGDILVQLMLSMMHFDGRADRVLNGPTNDAWLLPWADYLKEEGVKYFHGWTAQNIHYADFKQQSEPQFNTKEGNEVTGIDINDPDGKLHLITGDFYVFAVPVESMARLVGFDNAMGHFPIKVPPLNNELLKAAPTLRGLSALADDTNWMNGIQFYLSEMVPLLDGTKGHVIYSDTKWSLTSISQIQFWKGFELSEYGDGKVKSILSVDISNWYSPGYNGKEARNCTKEEIKNEIWLQLQKSLVVNKKEVLKDQDEILIDWYLDRDIVEVNATENSFKTQNTEPLLINKLDTWGLRPSSTTTISNMYIAADYVRTFTDLATMEGANEAARSAVNAIIEKLKTDEPKERKYRKMPFCKIWNLHEPGILAVLRWWDRRRYYKGLPWTPKFPWLILIIHSVFFLIMSIIMSISSLWRKNS